MTDAPRESRAQAGDASIPTLTDVLEPPPVLMDVLAPPMLTDVLAPGRTADAAVGVEVHLVQTPEVPITEWPPLSTALSAPSAGGPASLWPDASLDPGTASPDLAQLAARLESRLADYLAMDGRQLIEARCREALRAQAEPLVARIAQDVTHALENEWKTWIAQALAEVARHP